VLRTYSGKNEKMNRLQEIKERAEKATKGPWSCNTTMVGDVVYVDNQSKSKLSMFIFRWIHPFHRGADVEFIAHAREDIPWLIAKLEKLEKENS